MANCRAMEGLERKWIQLVSSEEKQFSHIAVADGMCDVMQSVPT